MSDASDDSERSSDPQDPHSPLELEELRKSIDELDRRLVELLNARARVVVDIGKVKRNTQVPIYAPHREAMVLRQALKNNIGPLPDRAIEGIFRELMSGSFSLEQPLRIGYLGPAGSFSHAAAVAHFGSSVSFEDLHEIQGVFTEVRRGHVDYGLVPVENSTGGSIAETLDAFRDTLGEVYIYSEAIISVRHSLLANVQPREVRRIYSKPEIFAQCRRWLATQYPQAELIPAPSSAAAVKLAQEIYERDPGCGVAALGSALAGQLYGVKVLFSDIEDNPNNITRFAILARQRAQRSGQDKTSIMFTTRNEPGALLAVLTAFAENGINLTHIDKRPSGLENWTYTFFIDADGHADDEPMIRALEVARERCQMLHVLGSYPRALQVL